jgi:hypothetical protein
MKRFNFPLVAVMLGLVLVFASCGLTQPGYGDEGYSERPVRGRQVYGDPYYSNAPTIVRDPYTGRYYEVSPVSPYGYDTYSYPYGSYGNTRYYGNRRSTVYNNRSREHRTNTPRTSPQTQTKPSRGSSETINKAKGIIRKD